MAGLTDAYKKAVLDYTFSNQPNIPAVGGYSATAVAGTLYVGLLTGAAPSANGTDDTAEVTGGSYARVLIDANTFGNATGSAGTNTITNTADIVFPTASADWGEITHVAIFVNNTADSDYYFWDALSPTKTVTENDTLTIPATQLTITLT